jgi:hypothetical protein
MKNHLTVKVLVFICLALLLAACSSPVAPATPQIKLLVDKSNLTTLSPVTLSAEVTNFNVSKLEFYEGSTKLAEVSSKPYQFSINFTQPEVAEHNYSAKAIDPSGKSISSNTVTVAVNTPSALKIDPSETTVLAGASPVTYFAYLAGSGGTKSVSVDWELQGPGSLSSPSGESVVYTPPTTIAATTPATIKAVYKATGQAGQAALTISPPTDTGKKYIVVATISNDAAYPTRADIFVNTSDGASFSSATVRVNGEALPAVGIGYAGNLKTVIASGSQILLEVVVPEGTISGTLTMPSTPTITAPSNGASVSASQPLNLAWTSSASPSYFLAAYATVPFDNDLYTVATLTGDKRSHSFSGIPSNKTLNVIVTAYNETKTLLGPVVPNTSLYSARFGTSNEITITP